MNSISVSVRNTEYKNVFRECYHPVSESWHLESVTLISSIHVIILHKHNRRERGAYGRNQCARHRKYSSPRLQLPTHSDRAVGPGARRRGSFPKTSAVAHLSEPVSSVNILYQIFLKAHPSFCSKLGQYNIATASAGSLGELYVARGQ